MENNKYVVFQNDSKKYNLNIVGIRNVDPNEVNANTFNDLLVLFYKYNGVFYNLQVSCTVDPGTYYRVNPMNNLGTGIIMKGQYRNMLRLGLHRGQYEALVQQNPCDVIRDNNKDNTLDYNPPVSYHSINTGNTRNGTTLITYLDEFNNVMFRIERGVFGVNIHKAGKDSKLVDKWSAACTVVAKESDYNNVIGLAKESAKIFGNNFTYTILHNDEL